jgi:hypothetical protein
MGQYPLRGVVGFSYHNKEIPYSFTINSEKPSFQLTLIALTPEVSILIIIL